MGSSATSGDRFISDRKMTGRMRKNFLNRNSDSSLTWNLFRVRYIL